MIHAVLAALLASSPVTAPTQWTYDDYSTKPPKEAAEHALKFILERVWDRRTNVSLPSPIISFRFFLRPKVSRPGVCYSTTFIITPIEGEESITDGGSFMKYLDPQPTFTGEERDDERTTQLACNQLTSSRGFFRSDGGETAWKAARLLGQASTAARYPGPLPFSLTAEGISAAEARRLLSRLTLDDIVAVKLTGETMSFQIEVALEERDGGQTTLLFDDERQVSKLRLLRRMVIH